MILRPLSDLRLFFARIAICTCQYNWHFCAYNWQVKYGHVDVGEKSENQRKGEVLLSESEQFNSVITTAQRGMRSGRHKMTTVQAATIVGI